MVRAADRQELFLKVLNKAGLRFQTVLFCFLHQFIESVLITLSATECCGCRRALLWFCTCRLVFSSLPVLEVKRHGAMGAELGRNPWERGGLCVLGAVEVGWGAAGRCADRLCLRVLLLSAFPLKPT